MEPVILEKRELGNGLVMELYDCSRHVAGDRWLVSFRARMDVDVRPEDFPGDSGLPDYRAIQAVLGNRVTYEYRNERNFIAIAEKEQLLEEMKDNFIKTKLPYVASPDFSRKLVLAKFRQTKTVVPSFLRV